ncbi:tetratricopeptide repeat-containing sensor histidine kinase [Marivirga sp. S37H4]|uniref:histidine kinase n=1 Tax=Marivirga aurantiaca TaxID=2802615 RepID=A0A935CCF6_9BACT|nr:tetratricopeptide repeat-containing sensor histidine kinase [Marivirga aurantiaca]MBK6266008.1 tetratricopeptide repeat-containing sensor histidine kinase [Marivirga aurantiaca]
MHKVLFGAIFYFIIYFPAQLIAEISHDSLQSVYMHQLTLSSDSLDSTMDFSMMTSRFLEDIFKDNTISDAEMLDVLILAAKGEKLNKYKEATHLLKSVIPWVQEKPVYLAYLHSKIGDYYFNERKSIDAVEQFIKAALLYEKQNLIQPLARSYLYISMINLRGNNDKIGLTYAEQALDYMKLVKLTSRADSDILRGLYGVKGVLERRLGDYEKAIISTDESIRISKEMNDSVIVAISNGNKAVIYYEMGDMESALPLLEQDYKTSNEAKIYFSAFNAGIYLCKVHAALGNQQALRKTFEEITTLYEEHEITNETSKAEYFKIGAELAQANNDVSKANYYLMKFMEVDQIRDSINKVNDVAQLQEKYLLEKEIAKLELLQKTNVLQASHLKLRTAILIIIALALIIVLWYVFVLKQKNKKIDRLNELLEAKVSERTNRLMEINKELDTYLYRASHDIRRPIRTLLGLNNVAKLTNDKEALEELFEQVHFTALNMDKMLFKLQMAYELNNDHPIEEVNLENLVQKCLKDMALEIEAHNANFKIDIPNHALYVQANEHLILMILDNIIENSLLYQNHGNPEIEISTDMGKYYFYIHVKDNGYGIPEEYFKKVFSSYFKISNKTQGSGLGLFLAYRAVSYLGGDITIQSVINKGSHFTIKLPVSPK